MPTVRIRITPASRAAATNSASGPGPRSRWVWESITDGSVRGCGARQNPSRSRTGPSGLGEERRELLDAGSAGHRAVRRAGERAVVGAERVQEPLRGLGDVGG